MTHLYRLLPLLLVLGCGSNEADALGVGAECTVSDECNQDTDPPQSCLTDFTGGYCGISGCTEAADCPANSFCVTHTNDVNYCFRTCVDKPECNTNRTVMNESNCSANITEVGDSGSKACVPPSG